jgi:hypothetical protein
MESQQATALHSAIMESMILVVLLVDIHPSQRRNTRKNRYRSATYFIQAKFYFIYLSGIQQKHYYSRSEQKHCSVNK